MKNFVLLLTPLLFAAMAAFAEEPGVFDYDSLPGRPVAVVSAESLDALLQEMRSTEPGVILSDGAAGIPAISRMLDQARLLFVSATGLPADQLKVLLNSRCTAAFLESTGESGILPVAFVVNAADFRDESKNTLRANLMPALILMLDDDLRIETDANDTRLVNRDDGVVFRVSSVNDDLIFELNPHAAAPQSSLRDDTEFQRVSQNIQLGSGLSGYVDMPLLLAELNKHRLYERCSRIIRASRIDSGAAAFNTTVRDGAIEDRIFVSLPGVAEAVRQHEIEEVDGFHSS